MCGFAGIYTRDGSAPALDVLDPMLDVMRHRGPDDRGTWHDGRVAFGHLRLTILDLTERAHQPMTAPDGAALVYNGEVYNFPQLRRELEAEGVTFRSTGDTEVVFEALRRWGPREATPRFNGMFAFAYWDAASNALWLARDRLGIKPVYVTRAGRAFVFASEIKGLLAHPDVSARPDLRWLPTMLAQGRIDASRTLFEGIEALAAGSLWRVDGAGVERHRYFDAVRDVDPERIVAAMQEDPELAPDRFEAALRESVHAHVASDVGLATMCSGGVDSSLVTALAAEVVDDLTAYVADVGGEVSEWEQAAKVGRHLDVPVHRIEIDRSRHFRLLPETTWHLEAPNMHPSDTALLSVTRRCREDGIKVLLTGEGADELFGGYPWLTQTWRAWRSKESLRYRLRSRKTRRERDRMRLRVGPFQSDIARHLPPLRWRLLTILDADAETRGQRLMRRLAPVEPESDRAYLAAGIDDLYRHLSSILQRHDRMGMAASMEMRVPFLENGVIDLGLHAPRRWKLHDGQTKWMVKRVADRRLPRDVVHATKKGFPVPVSFRQGMEGFLEEGTLSELMGWSPETTSEVIALSFADAAGPVRLLSLDVWARIFLRGEDPAELGERLAVQVGGNDRPPPAS